MLLEEGNGYWVGIIIYVNLLFVYIFFDWCLIIGVGGCLVLISSVIFMREVEFDIGVCRGLGY